MNILVVDDQKYVIDGIKKGIDFRQIGFEEIYFAYSAFEAKKIIQEHAIDVLLCDIEMPYENGLQLLEWIRANEYTLECIFLTAHANFDYARTAVALGSFEYILQPARYQDIQERLIRLVQKIVKNREKEQFYSYGKQLYMEKDKLAEFSIQSWFYDPESITNDKLLQYIDLDQTELTQTEKVYLVKMKVSEKNKKDSDWTEELIYFSCKNILQELCLKDSMESKIYRLGKLEYLLFLHSKEKIFMESCQSRLVEFMDFVQKYFGFQLALHCGFVTSFEEINEQAIAIRKLQERYPADQMGIYTIDTESPKVHYDIIFPEKTRWENFLLQGFGVSVIQEAGDILENAQQKNQLTASFLKNMYIYYLSVLSTVLSKTDVAYEEIFGDEDDLEAYSSRECMEKFIYKSSSFFNQTDSFNQDDKQQVEKIKEYIYQNLEQDIRRDDIAEAVFLNPNYVSRLFKKETGKNLKEFITEEKLKLAKTLIQETNLPISLIAVKVGYTNFSHFSQLYKKCFKMSPSEERKE